LTNSLDLCYPAFVTTFTAKVSKTGSIKIPAEVMKHARIKIGGTIALALPSAGKKQHSRTPGKNGSAIAEDNGSVVKDTRYADPKTFARVLDEVIRDYSTTLRNLA
jgi:ribose 5-phosphate isomerase